MRWAALLPACAGVGLYALAIGAAHGSNRKLHAGAAAEHGRRDASARAAYALPVVQDTARTPPVEPQDTTPAEALGPRLGLDALLAALPPIPRRELRPELRRPRFRLRFADWSGLWARGVETKLAAVDDSLWAEARPQPPPPPPLAVVPEEPAEPGVEPAAPAAPPPPAGREPGGVLPEALAEYADLQMLVQGRLELGGGWSRFRPCDLSLRLNCNPSAIPTIKPDLQFGLRVGGTVSERIHVNVDYDNAREFDAANNINVYYQGLEDEILQRFEVGDVSFSLPRSRYLTRAIPAGNFGFRATGQLGPLEFQTIWAQQKGDLGTRSFTLGTGGQGFVQDQTTVLDDADYQRGQFFFLFHPRRIAGYPHIDIQRLTAADVPAQFQPASTIKLYRYEGAFRGTRQGSVQENTIEAIAVALDTIPTPTGDVVVADTLRGTFRVLEESKDFLVHLSGLWIMLRSPVVATEGLAVVYRTATDDEVGTFNAEAVFAAHVQDSTLPLPVLELLKDVNHRPGEATWEREMHNVYRVSGGGGVDAVSVDLVISQGDVALDQTFRLAPNGIPINFLKIFGVDDEPSDERLDRAHLYQPTIEDASVGEAGPTGTYIILPTLRPFFEPPPLQGVTFDPSLEGGPFPLDAGEKNGTIYEDPLDVRRESANLYRLTLEYRTRQEGVISSFNVGAVGIREGSERISIGGTLLERGPDYTIDYSTGRVELREPDRWFGAGATPQIEVRYEQKPLFQLAPTSVFGFNARTEFGRTGELNFVGLAQNEQSLQTRPELGLEPGAVKLAGVSGRFQWESAWLTRMVDALPLISADQGSSIQLEGELATSIPTTNTAGATYVEDFEGGTGFDLFLLARAWNHGSAPSTTAGALSELPAFLDEVSYAPMVWQDQWVDQGSNQVVGPWRPRQIDEQLRVQSEAGPGEPVLYLSIDPPSAGRGWRSLTTVISPTGRDFTTLEFLEFYVGLPDVFADSLNLIFDLGTVSEDAFVLDSDGMPSGLGRLDQEADRTTQIWSDANDVGLWNTGCTAQRGIIAYLLGNEAANCTRNNGLNDSEDLNGDNQLQTDERYFRYTVRVGDPSSPYYVRDANTYVEDAQGNPLARFRLFRIPLRRPDHIEGATFAEFQNIRHLRVTISSGSSAQYVAILARMKFLGSRWLKRGQEGVVRGLTDTLSSLNPSSLVEVGPISTLDPNYESPPGIRDQLANQTDVLPTGQAIFNEQSLRVRFRDLEPGERAEVYLQYPQTPRNMLTYGALRLWALGWEGGWGPTGDLRLFVKIGEDGGNFYLYRTTLPAVPPGASGTQLVDAWRPEHIIDFARLIALRTAAEDTILRSGGLPGGTQLVLWDVDALEGGDSTYAVVISQVSRPPNLAAVRQISLGVYNAGPVLVPAGELWVDDVRLDGASDDIGLAGQVHLNVRASDVLDFRASFEGQNPYFRQLGDLPGFQTGSSLDLGGTLRLGRFLPTSWALDMPLAFSYRDGGSDPYFLPRTDIRGEGLRDLRSPEHSSWRADLSIRRSGRTTPTPRIGWLVDRLSLRLSWTSDRNRAQRSLLEGDRFAATLAYASDVGNVSVPLVPSFLRPVFFFLPDAVRDTRLRLSPRAVSFGADFGDATSESRRFESIVRLPGDADATPLRTYQSDLRHTTTLQLLPLPALDGRLSFSQNRDLVPPNRVAAGETARGLIDAERSSLFGVGVGWETQRNLSVSLSYRPRIVPWFTPSASWASSFNARRNASYLGVEAPSDTVLQRDFDNSRRLQAGTQFNLQAFADAVTGNRGGVWGALRGASRWIDIIQLGWSGSAVSDFRRQTAEPSFGYQLALGSVESFRVVDGDTATRVLTSEAWSAGSGLILPIGAVLSADYRVSEGNGWTPRSQNASESVDWPNLQFNWSRVPLPGFIQGAVRNATVRVGYSERETQDRNLGADQIRIREETRIPASVSIGLTTGWTLSYSVDQSRSLSVDPTGRTEGERFGHTVRVLAQVRPPASWRNLRNPIRINLGYRRDTTDQCRALGISTTGPETPETCAPFTDLTVQNVDLTVDTDVQPFTLGLQASWRDQQSDIGQRPGSTQLNFNLFGRFLFQSGPIR